MALTLVFALLFTQSPSAKSPGPQWHPAVYRALVIGRSRRADMLRAFGKPKWSRQVPGDEESEVPGVTWDNYERIGEFPGITNVASDSRTGVITRIDFYPAKLGKTEALAHFGRGYVVTRYAFDTCGGDEDSELIYESPNGPLVYAEYRQRGIAISIGVKDLVTKISYVSGPIGSPSPRCK